MTASLVDWDDMMLGGRWFPVRGEAVAYLQGWLDAFNIPPDDVEWRFSEGEVVAVLRVDLEKYIG